MLPENTAMKSWMIDFRVIFGIGIFGTQYICVSQLTANVAVLTWQTEM